jgi:hypothetical protein
LKSFSGGLKQSRYMALLMLLIKHVFKRCEEARLGPKEVLEIFVMICGETYELIVAIHSIFGKIIQ